jgi:hypothetical protein
MLGRGWRELLGSQRLLLAKEALSGCSWSAIVNGGITFVIRLAKQV